VSIRVKRQFAPFYFYSAVVLVLVCAAIGGGPSKISILILLVTGVLTWGLIEYVLHRFAFHFNATSSFGRKLLYAVHLAHHQHPRATDHLFANLQISVPIAGAYWLLAWGVLGNWRAASYLFIGFIAGYFCYEWLHFKAHHGQSRLQLFRYLKKHHLMHHYRTPNLRFGVTSPFFDIVFRTFPPVADTSRAASTVDSGGTFKSKS
jgi:sterol desaturase/sphingolipid hydroxylase (fatty acid hydroxylase superfamily)